MGKFNLTSYGQSSRQNVGEIEWRIFCQTLCSGNFLLCTQSLVKMTSDALERRNTYFEIIMVSISSTFFARIFRTFNPNVTEKKDVHMKNSLKKRW